MESVEHFSIASQEDVQEAMFNLQQYEQENWWLDSGKPQRRKRLDWRQKMLLKWRTRCSAKQRMVRRASLNLQRTQEDPNAIIRIASMQRAFSAWAWSIGPHCPSEGEFETDKQHVATSFAWSLLLKFQTDMREALKAQDYLRAHEIQQRQQSLLQLKETMDEEPAEEPEPMGPEPLQTKTAQGSELGMEEEDEKEVEEGVQMVDEPQSSAEPEAGPYPARDKADVEGSAKMSEEGILVGNATPEASSETVTAAPDETVNAGVAETVIAAAGETVGKENSTIVEEWGDASNATSASSKSSSSAQNAPASSSMTTLFEWAGWNPNVRCGRYSAQERLQFVMSSTGKTEKDSKLQIMWEFSAEFYGEDTPGWLPNVLCDGRLAQDRALWLCNEHDYNLIWARLQVMSEYPRQFHEEPTPGWKPKVVISGYTAEEHAMWVAQKNRKTLSWAREKVMRDNPRRFDRIAT